KFDNKAYMMSGKFWANNHTHVLKAIEGKGSNKFILHLLNFLDLNPYIVGTTRKKLNQEHMRRIIIPLPPLQEQQKIAEILSTIDKKLELLRNEIAKLERTKKGLMDLLLTGKIRVKL
ncbi:MAG: restriction endonuclease subunit S, partial [Candidatus Nitrosocaldus sp.]